ncbi:MAG: aromatic aminobenezylarsenical efflux permease ArsG family transporter [Deltaproteobacteria bacterium]
MTEQFVDLGAVSALWLGILTSLSPCPLATNIAAVSYLGRQYRSPATVAFSGLTYVLGRMGAYLGLGALLVAGLLSAPGLSMFLQKSMNKVLGPVLILTGMVLLDLLRFRTLGRGVGEKMREKAGKGGLLGAGLLGVLFALSFCPVSAALFFGSLVPLSVRGNSPVFYPLLFGFGTGIPVIAFAVMIAFGVRSIEAVFRGVTRVELWVRWITGAVFLVAGLYYSAVYIFEVM